MEFLIQYAMGWLGTPYKWGGQSRAGVDCSGLVQEILVSVGEDPPKDQTAHGLHRYFANHGQQTLATPQAGALVFYGSYDKITHIAFAIDSFRIIEAGGGNRDVRTPQDADHHNAYVRIRPYDYRNDVYEIIMPEYTRIWRGYND